MVPRAKELLNFVSTELAHRATSGQGLPSVWTHWRDTDDFDEAFHRLLPRAKRTAYAILGDITDAEDAAVEALGRASVRWRRLGGLPSSKQDAWVLRVTANVAYDELRRRVRRRRPLPASPMQDGQEAHSHIDLRDSVVTALAALSRREKEVLTLRYIGGYSEAEIADSLGVSAGSVKTLASRGLGKMRARLGSSWGELDEVD